jgi:hypothetical protein
MPIILPHDLHCNDLIDKIPKIIHQTYKSRETVPEIWEEGVKSWEALAQNQENEFTYVFWDDFAIDQFIKTKWNDYYDFWKTRKYTIQRIDLFRYFMLETYGGVYIDCDLGLNVTHERWEKFFDYYKNFNVVLSESESSGRFVYVDSSCTNAFMMSRADQAFWKTLFEEMMTSPKNNIKKMLSCCFKHFKIINSYGPGLINDVNECFKNDESIVSIPKQLTAPGFAWSIKPFSSKDSILTVLEGSSWCDHSSQMLFNLNKAYHYRDLFILPIIILLSIVIVILSVFVVLKKKK